MAEVRGLESKIGKERKLEEIVTHSIPARVDSLHCMTDHRAILRKGLFKLVCCNSPCHTIKQNVSRGQSFRTDVSVLTISVI